MEVIWIILIVFGLIVLFSSLKIVQEYERGVIFFFRSGYWCPGSGTHYPGPLFGKNAKSLPSNGNDGDPVAKDNNQG